MTGKPHAHHRLSIRQRHESAPHHDYDVWLGKSVPHEPVSQYRHNETGEDNADAHVKRQIMGREVVAVTDGRLDFGRWEQNFYGGIRLAENEMGAAEDHLGIAGLEVEAGRANQEAHAQTR